MNGGSIRAQIRQAEGWIEGTPKYAFSEPHHCGTSMCYREMYNASLEEKLTLAIETEEPIEVGGLWVRCYAPNYESEINECECFLVRHTGGIHDEVKIDWKKIIDFDFSSEEECEDGRIIRDCYDATIGNL